MKIFAFVSILSTLAFTTQGHAEIEKAPADADTQFSSGPPIPFIPFSLEEICSPSITNECKAPSANEVVKFLNEKGDIVFEGKASEYLQFINDKEKFFSEKGVSLRDENGDFDYQKIPTDVNALREQILAQLNLGDAALSKVKDALSPENCGKLPFTGRDIEGPSASDYVPLPDGRSVPLHQMANRISDNQRVLCSLGHDFLSAIDAKAFKSPKAFLKAVLDNRELVIKNLGLEEYTTSLGLEGLEEIKEYADMAKSVADILQAKKFPSPQQILDARNQIASTLNIDLQIPEIPSIPSPLPPLDITLDLKKRKDWNGFHIGNDKIVSAYAKAFLDIRGSETEQQMTASGDAGFYIISKQISAISGFAQANVRPSGIDGTMKAFFFGQEVHEEKFIEKIKYELNGADLFDWSFEVEHTQQFAIGPIPVNVTLGAYAALSLSVDWGITTTNIYGRVVPSADAGAYASAAVGLARVLSVGIEGKIKLIDIEVPLGAEAGVAFDEAAAPYIKMRITSTVDYNALAGSLSAYAEYPKFKKSFPFIKIKKDRKTLWNFAGYSVSHSIMNWGVDIGRRGVKPIGDLTDVADLKELKDLEGQIFLAERENAVIKLESELKDKLEKGFATVKSDLGSQKTTDMPKDIQTIEQLKANADQEAQALKALVVN